MQKLIKLFIVAIISFFSTFEANAALSPLSVGLVPPLQFPPSDFSVTGFRASLLWGRHRDLYGLDLGVLGNITDQDFTGIGISGIFNVTHGTTNVIGLQLAGAANINTQKVRVYGFQIAGLLNKNDGESTVSGLQFAAVNLSEHTDIYGFQVGVYNRAKSVYGLQIGLINTCTDLHGLQIGLLNFHHNGLFVVSPILNVGF